MKHLAYFLILCVGLLLAGCAPRFAAPASNYGCFECIEECNGGVLPKENEIYERLICCDECAILCEGMNYCK